MGPLVNDEPEVRTARVNPLVSSRGNPEVHRAIQESSMSRRVLFLAGMALALSLAATSASAQEEMAAPAMMAVAGADVAFADADLPGFLPGMQIATIQGDPSVADEPYTLRLLLPEGYAFPPHWHPRAENLTVLEGWLHLAMGEAYDEAALETYGPGDYLFIEGENPHFGKATARTVLQLHGIGPFDIQVVEGQEMTQ
jgi:hypothetical protein